MLSRLTRTIALASVLTVAMVTVAAGSASAASYATIVPKKTNTTASGPLVVGIGDSILEGHGLTADQAWLSVLAKEDGWRLTNLASDGSGFVTAGNNGDTFDDQVTAAISLHPDVIVISGSSNDLGQSDAAIDTATTATIERLSAALPNTKIIAVSAVWGDTALPAQMRAINRDVVTTTMAVGATYLDVGQPLSGRSDLMQSDDVHPTAAGQRVLAAAVEQALTASKVSV